MNGLAPVPFDPEFDLPLPSARQQARTLQIETDFVRRTLRRLACENAARQRLIARRVNRLVAAIGAHTAAAAALCGALLEGRKA